MPSMKLIFAAAITTLAFLGAGLAASAQSSAPLPRASYSIHPGDQLSVQIYGEQSLSSNVTVLSDGTVDYPLIGRVLLAGKSPSEASTIIASRMKKYLRNPIVEIAVVTMAQPTVLVLGNVKNPGKYQIRADGKLSDALAAAGGMGVTDGPWPDARIAWTNGQITNVSLQKLLHDGNVSLDVPLSDGSVVYVPGAQTINIEVIGAVDHPGEIQVNDGDHLSTAIAKAGDSANAGADLNNIRVVRVAPDGTRTTTSVNLYKALERGDSAQDLKLQKGDVVYVPQARKGIGQGATGSGIIGVLGILGRLLIP